MHRRTVLRLLLSSTVLAATRALPAESTGQMTLYKNAECGCCGTYTEYLRENGFAVTVVETPHLPMMYSHYNVPSALQSCHLATLDRYIAVGHIPVDVIKRMLAEQPAIAGIALPGMPAGAPGMGGSKAEAFKIYALGDGAPKLYAID